MAEDGGKKEEEKLEFTPEGKTLGYISLDQARVLAMRTAREAPGVYGRRFRNVPMAFEVVEDDETEDHYVVTLSFRPQGQFTGTPGQEQFFIEKEGAVAHRQVLGLPAPAGGRRFPVVPVAIGLAAVAIAVVVGVGDGGDSPVAALIPTSTLTQTPTRVPATPTAAPLALVATPVATPTPTPLLTPGATPEPTSTTASIPTATPIAVPTPTATTSPPNPTAATPPAFLVVEVPPGVLVSGSELLSKPWVQGTRDDNPDQQWNQQIVAFALSSDHSTMYATAEPGKGHYVLYKSSDRGRTWRSVATGDDRSGPGTTGPAVAAGLAFDPVDPQKIYAHRWRSNDGGETWTRSDPSPQGGLIVYPDVLYSGRFQSEDDGQTWREVNTEYGVHLGAPGYPSALYYFQSGSSFTLLKSKDGAITWNRVATPQVNEALNVVQFDSTDPPNIYVGWPEAGLFRANALDPKE